MKLIKEVTDTGTFYCNQAHTFYVYVPRSKVEAWVSQHIDGQFLTYEVSRSVAANILRTLRSFPDKK